VAFTGAGYMVATRYETRYYWLHGGYMSTKEKGFTTMFIAMNPYLYWCRIVDTI